MPAQGAAPSGPLIAAECFKLPDAGGGIGQDANGKTGVNNDCFIYGKDGALVFKHIGKETVNLTLFDQEVRKSVKY